MIPSDLPDLIGGKYRPLGIIGVGAMGIVYSAEHTLTGEHFAVKLMTAHLGASREAIERFKREARASARIKSEHVVRVIDADVAPELDRAPYIVMDLLEGTDLEKLCGDQAVPKAQVIEWMRQISRALDKAHRLGITHRDLKPENLFLTHREDGSPLIKILDFGIAKLTAESTGTTQSGQILGTPLYMSPEQARGDANAISPASDLYSLGLVAFKLLTGAPFWKATSVAGLIGQVLYEPMRAPSASGCGLGPEFDAWFLRACDRDPSQRFPSAGVQVEALAKALGLPADPRNEYMKSNPGESNQPAAADVSSVTTAPVERDRAAAVGQSGGTLVSSSSEKRDVRVLAPRFTRARKIIFSIASAAALLCIGVILFVQREPIPSGGMKHASLVPEPAFVPSAVAAPAPAALAAAAAVVPDEALPAPSAPPASASAEAPVRPAKRKGALKPTKPASSPASPARSDKPVHDDPLGDQK